MAPLTGPSPRRSERRAYDLPIDGADRRALAAGQPDVEGVRTAQLPSDGDRSQKADHACPRRGIGRLRGALSRDRHARIEDNPLYSILSSRPRPSAAAVDIFDFGAAAMIASMKASACAFVITRPFDRLSATRTGTIAAAGFP